MKMVIGGAYQGKTDYAKQVYPNLVWSDGASCDLKDIFSCSGIVHFEEFVRRWIRENKAEHATDLAEQILSGGEGQLGTMSREELMELLEC